MIDNISGKMEIRRIVDGKYTDAEDQLAIEEPLEIQLSFNEDEKRITKSIAVTMRTPGNDDELAAGFLFTEGIIQSREQVASISASGYPANQVLVTLNNNERPFLQNAERNFYTSSSCGVCGKASIDAIRTVSVFQDEGDDIRISAKLFYHLQDQLKNQQHIFETTGGLHASALFDLDGCFTWLREDVGRHNALDKLIGASFMNDQLPLNKSMLLLSGRASFELVQKAIMAGIKIIAAVGAPSSLAVDLAGQGGITLVGFLRKERFNIYTAWHRIVL